MPFYIRNNKFLVTPNNLFALSCGGTPDPSCCFFNSSTVAFSRVAGVSSPVPLAFAPHPEFGTTVFSGTLSSTWRNAINNGEDLSGDFSAVTSISPVRADTTSNGSGGFCCTRLNVSAVIPNGLTQFQGGNPVLTTNLPINLNHVLTLGTDNTPTLDCSFGGRAVTGGRTGCDLNGFIASNIVQGGYLASEVVFNWPSRANPSFTFFASKNREGIVASTSVTFNVEYQDTFGDPKPLGSCPATIAQILSALGCPPAAQAVQGSGDCGCGCGDCG